VPSHVLLVHSDPETPARGHVPIAPLVWMERGRRGSEERCRCRPRPSLVVRRQVWILDLLASKETFAYGQGQLVPQTMALDCCVWNFDVASYMIPLSWLAIRGTELASLRVYDKWATRKCVARYTYRCGDSK